MAAARTSESRWRAGVAVVLALVVPAACWLVAGVVAGAYDRWLASPQGSPGSGAVTVDVPPGEDARAIARRLRAAGLLEHELPFLVHLRLSGRASRLHAGEYRFGERPTPRELLDALVSGDVVLHPLTVPEGLTLRDLRAMLVATGRWSVADLDAALSDVALVADLDPEADDLEGYLFPETYHLPRRAPARQLVQAMVDRFRLVFERHGGRTRAAELGLTVREAVTLASLIEEETALPQEHRLVSSVFHNRLARGMRLECDPTVIHALQRDGLWEGGPLRRDQLGHDSPYNTYVSPGLPPGPISSPGEGALAAALDPARSRLLFFVASGDGGHRFAETQAQHRRNVRLWRQHQAR